MVTRLIAGVIATLLAGPAFGQASEPELTAQLQRLLNSRDCDAGAVDGKWGRRSAVALLRFSEKYGSAIDFPVSPETLQAIDAATVRCEPVPRSAADERLHRTWAEGVISIPKTITATGKFCRGSMDSERVQACIADVRPDANTPAIVFMHGCDGMNLGYVAYLGSLGYPVFAPDSLARGNRKTDCRYNSDKKPILRARLDESRYALEQVRKLPWVDPNRIVLAGFSEGGVTTALHEQGEISGKIIFGWSCNAFDPWWRGVRGSKDIPVLAIVGADDPYHQNPSNRGDCGEFIGNRKNSASIIIPKAEHDILRYRQTTGAVPAFVKSLW